jgi:phosphonate dehydrogenase
VPSERPLVVYTHAAPPVGTFLVRAICDVREGPDRGRTRAEIVRDARDADGLCIFVPDVIDDGLLAQLPKLRVLAHFGKGYDNVDLSSATRRGIWVTNVPADLTDATADLAWGLILALSRKIVAGDRAIREGLLPAWHPTRLLGTHVTGATLGIIGFGAIGKAIAKRARGFDCRILYYDVRRAPAEVERGLGVEYASFSDVLREAEIVVPVVPAQPETRNLIDAAALARMRRGALLVNVARGSVVDENAVAAALRERTLGGYAADAFACEERLNPLAPRGVPPALLNERERTVFTPHIGTAVASVREALAIVQAENVLAALRGERPPNAVNQPIFTRNAGGRT